MKTFLTALLTAFIFISCSDDSVINPVQPTPADIQVTQFTWVDNIIGYGSRYQVKLKNSGGTAAGNIILKINYTLIRGTASLNDSATFTWPDTLNAGAEEYRAFDITYPDSCKTDTAHLRISY